MSTSFPQCSGDCCSVTDCRHQTGQGQTAALQVMGRSLNYKLMPSGRNEFVPNNFWKYLQIFSDWPHLSKMVSLEIRLGLTDLRDG